MIKNPISAGVRSIGDQFSLLSWQGANAVPSAITAAVLTLVVALLIAMWPYGLFAVVEDLMRTMMQDTRQSMMKLSLISKMPYAMTLGIYFCFWLPFVTICLPMILIGWLGSFASK